MEKCSQKSLLRLSLVTAMLLGSNAYAGKIITDANLSNIVVEENTQFGFGGWNFDNVDVRIVNIADFSTPTLGTFDTSTGVYTGMGVDMSFESDIKNAEGTVMGHLHGKDWPVGEPAGIKIINGDTKTSNGKPENCIMTSSYLDDGYLDVFPEQTPKPVLCSSPWQSHKRYKINLLPSTVEGVVPGNYGNPVDLVFNLDPTDMSTGITKYQVLQKANNYTGMRLDGYKVEVFDSNGFKNPALTLSLGLGEGIDQDSGLPDGSDIWAENEMANFSHGLWGPYQKVGDVVRFENGFFDWVRVYFDVSLADNNTTIEHVGEMLGGNYQSLFGNWLPSIWEPMGIFHDDDQDPSTDGVLKAFLGVAPGHTERAWYKSTVVDLDPNDNVDPVYTWDPATAEDLATWSGEWYDRGPVEDVLNLGLNYIINIGENAAIGSTFTLRITPHVDVNQTPPSSYAEPILGVDNDYNRDGVPDILFSQADGGLVKAWEMNKDISVLFTNDITDLESADWEVVESAVDIDGDGYLDILTQNTVTGEIKALKMDGFNVASTNLIPVPSADWKIVGLGDIDSDGYKDIIIQKDSNGYVRAIKTAAGLTYDSTLWVGNPGSVDFKVVEVTDVDGDAIPDIILQNSTNGYVRALKLTADFSSTNHWVGNPGNVDLKAVGVIDVDGDTIPDIILQNSTNGYVRALKLATDFTSTNHWVGNPGSAEWKAVDVTDIDGDTIPDIILENSTSRHVRALRLAADFSSTNLWVGNPGSADSKVKRVQDMDGDGIADIILQDSTTGYVKAFKLDITFKGTLQWVGNPGESISWEVE